MNRLSAIRPVLLVAAPFFLALGLVLPLVRFEKLWFFDETPSLLEIVVSLWGGGDVALAALVALVSIVLPVLKMIGIAAEAVAAGGTGSLFYRNVVPHLSKWSMMDGAARRDRDCGSEDDRTCECVYAARPLVLRSLGNDFGPSSLPRGKCARPEIIKIEWNVISGGTAGCAWCAGRRDHGC